MKKLFEKKKKKEKREVLVALLGNLGNVMTETVCPPRKMARQNTGA